MQTVLFSKTLKANKKNLKVQKKI